MYNKIFIPGWAVHPKEYNSLTKDGWNVQSFGFFTDENSSIDINSAGDDLACRISEDTVIMAHSLGCAFALQTALKNKQVKALILLSPFAKFSVAENWDGQEIRALRAMKMILKRNSVKLLNDFYKNCASPECWDVKIPEVVDKEQLLTGLDLLGSVDIREEIINLKIPVLMIHGSEDMICRLSVAEQTAKLLTDSDLKVINNAGHSLPFTRSKECQILINQFLDGRSI